MLTPSDRQKILNQLTDDEKLRLLYEWAFWARKEQMPPCQDWLAWVIQAGRGFGKTRVGAEQTREWAEEEPKIRIALVGRTEEDAYKIMIEGDSGLLACCPPWDRPRWIGSKKKLVWKNGTQAFLMSADNPDSFRGPQFHKAWCDEGAAYRYVETLEMLDFGVRLGVLPQIVHTTTPKPTPSYKFILKSEGLVVTRGSTRDNIANLAPAFIRKVFSKYDGTRLGRQELLGELLDDNPNALFQRSWIDKRRVRKYPELEYIVVAIDPAATSYRGAAAGKKKNDSDDDPDETAIVVVAKGADGEGYVLEDLTSVYTPNEWARVAVSAYKRWGANKIVAESNNGGEMVAATIQNCDSSVPVQLVWASKGKITRAEPISLLYEQGRIHHWGTFAELEDQMCDYEPLLANQQSPDRMDAVVWGLTYLFGDAPGIVHGFDY